MNNKPSGNKPKIITPPLMPTWAMFNFNPLSGNASHFIILLCLMPDDFTHQGESAATQWVNLPMHPVNHLSGNAPHFIVLLCLTPYDVVYSSEPSK
jgi:hypothetical protein